MDNSLKRKYLKQSFNQFLWEWLQVDIEMLQKEVDLYWIADLVQMSYDRFIKEMITADDAKLVEIDLQQATKDLYERYVIDFYKKNISKKIIA